VYEYTGQSGKESPGQGGWCGECVRIHLYTISKQCNSISFNRSSAVITSLGIVIYQIERVARPWLLAVPVHARHHVADDVE